MVLRPSSLGKKTGFGDTWSDDKRKRTTQGLVSYTGSSVRMAQNKEVNSKEVKARKEVNRGCLKKIK